jgi:hypothetical protein
MTKNPGSQNRGVQRNHGRGMAKSHSRSILRRNASIENSSPKDRKKPEEIRSSVFGFQFSVFSVQFAVFSLQ